MKVAGIHWETARQIKDLMSRGYSDEDAIRFLDEEVFDRRLVFTPDDIAKIAAVCDEVMVLPMPAGYWERLLSDGFASRIRGFVPEPSEMPVWAKAAFALGGVLIVYQLTRR